MMKKHLILVMLFLLTAPVVAGAQALFDAQKITKPVSNLFPIVPEAEIVGPPNGILSKLVTTKIYDRCMSRVPARFTSDAHKYYCTCSAAATQANIKNIELITLQKAENRVISNKTFEKYMVNVVKPCLDMPVEDTEYMYCILNRSNDWRIQLPIPFCRCVSRNIRDYFNEEGLEDLMIAWGNPKLDYADPLDALWNAENFSSVREIKREECVGGYLHPRYIRN